MEFVPDYPYAFEDKGAEDYFIACGWAEKTSEEPKRVYEEGSIEIDPDTMHYDHGVPVAMIIAHKGNVDKAKAAFGKERAEANAAAPLQPDDHISESEVTN